MNLYDTVLLKIKIYDVDWYPTIELLRADETMLIKGWMHVNSRISTAKNILHCFDCKTRNTREELLQMLQQQPTFAADMRVVQARSLAPNVDTDTKTESARYYFNDGLNWLHDAGLCYTDVTNPPLAIEKLSRTGKEVLTVLKMQADFYAAVDFLAPNGTCHYASATEEKLNCTLFGHPEWTEPKWLAEHLKWLSGVYTYGRDNASHAGSFGLVSNVSAMINYLRLVNSWQQQVFHWFEKNNADFWKRNRDS